MRIIIRILLAILTLLLVLAAWVYHRTDIEPVAWEPAPNPGLAGEFAPNDILAAMQPILSGVGRGPEDITRAADGWLFTGLEDGRIIRFQPGGEYQEYANTGGRPLGMQFDRDGDLVVADAMRGLVAVSTTGEVRVLTDQFDGRKLLFVDDLDIAADGTVWFSDASARYGYHDYMLDAFEGQASGRLLSYDPATGETAVHLDGLRFANGVALGPEDRFVLVNETVAGRIHRLWLKGERAGQRELFHPGLPGSPDNISFNGVDTFWVALPMARDAVDAIAGRPHLRKFIAGLPTRFRTGEIGGGAMVVGLDLEGRVKYNLQGAGDFRMITSVNEFDGRLYLGSVLMDRGAVLDLGGIAH